MIKNTEINLPPTAETVVKLHWATTRLVALFFCIVFVTLSKLDKHTHTHTPVLRCPLTLLFVLAGLLLQRPDGELYLFVAFSSQFFF